jgi:hypothetical protein
MAKDHFTSKGLTTPQMMAEASKYRNEFQLSYVELVDIVSIIEFKLVLRFPNFRLLIKRDDEMAEDAVTEPHKDRITVRRSVYRAACENDPKARLTLAHELGHFLLHRDKDVQMHRDQRGAIQKIRGMDSTQSTEAQADMFARHFLAPPRIAFRYRDDPVALARRTSIPLETSRGNITMSKRPSAYRFRASAKPKASQQNLNFENS